MQRVRQLFGACGLPYGDLTAARHRCKMVLCIERAARVSMRTFTASKGVPYVNINSLTLWLLSCVLGLACACFSPNPLAAEERPAAANSGEKRGEKLSVADRRREMARLRTALQTAEGPALSAAIEAWRSGGDAELAALAAALRHVLASDAKKLEKAGATLRDAAQAGQHESAVANLRAEMRTRIAALQNGPGIEDLRADYQRLASLLEPLQQVYARKLEIARLLGRRSLLLDAWRKTARKPEAQFGEAAEERLRAKCLAVLGTDDVEVPPFGKHDGPLAQVWFYRDCRAVEVYNAQAAREAELAHGELENIVAVNAYREALGLLPLEIDVRLVKAARGHSQEMARLGYFAHDSPTPGRTSFVDRMRLEGYLAGGGENILQGAKTGEQAFWIWFESPGHHRNMTTADFQSIGVGQHGELWTQNFGLGERAMLAK